MKKKLTSDQEFEIMKIVLDKILWVGVALMVYGLYLMNNATRMTYGLMWMVAGGTVLFLFSRIIVKNFHVDSK